MFPMIAGLQDIATFMLVRGAYAWIGVPWIGCLPPWDYDRPAFILRPVLVRRALLTPQANPESRYRRAKSTFLKEQPIGRRQEGNGPN